MEIQDNTDHIGKPYNQVYTLDYGGFESESLPNMPKDTCYSIGFNDTYGLIDVIDDNHKPYFEGRIDITEFLKELKFEDIEDKRPDSKEIVKISPFVKNYIMEAYDNFWNSEKDISSPTLEVLTYKGNSMK